MRLFYCGRYLMIVRYARPPKGKHDSWGKVVQVLSDTPDEARVPVFQAICKDWKPVMRHYFTERHKTPVSWFRMRLHYSRSVAATSIVGHILGLGDRHLSNILIHDPTGEMVNIDLGIAFEQVSSSQPFFVCLSLFMRRISGQGPKTTRARSVPFNQRHDRWHGELWHQRCLPTLCRGDPSSASRWL